MKQGLNNQLKNKPSCKINFTKEDKPGVE